MAAGDVQFDIIARDRASQALGDVGDAAQSAGRDLEGIGDQAQRGTGRLGGIMTAAGGVFAAAAGAVGGAAAAALLKGFSTALENGQIVSKAKAQLDLTAAEAERVGDVAGSLYAKAWGDSMDQTTQATAAAMSSIKGLRTATEADLKDASRRVLDFARTFDVDVAEAAMYAGNLLNTGLAKNAEHAFDLITRAASEVPAALRGDLTATIDEYGTYFDSLGFSGEQSMGLLVDAANKGRIGLDKFGDAAKEFTFLATDLDHAGESYARLGFNAKQMSNDILAGGDRAQAAFQKIVKAIAAVKDPSEQAALALKFFGTPLEDLDKTKIPDFVKTLAEVGDGLDGVAGASDRSGKNLNDNFANKITAAKNTATLALAEMGKAAIKAWEDMDPGDKAKWQEIGKDIAEMGRKFADFAASEDGKKVIESITNGALAATKMAAGLGELSMWLIKTQHGFEDTAESVMTHIAGGAIRGFGLLLAAATASLGWIPGIGPKLKQAQKDFDQFATEANNALERIRDRNVSVNVQLRGITNVQEQMNTRLGRRAAGGPVRAGNAYVVGDGGRPEVFVPNSDGRIIPSIEQARGGWPGPGGATAGGGQGQVVTLRLDPTSSGAALDRVFLSWLQRSLRDNNIKL